MPTTTENPALIAARKTLWATYKSKTLHGQAKLRAIQDARTECDRLEGRPSQQPAAYTPPAIPPGPSAADRAATAAALAKTAEDSLRSKVIRAGMTLLNIRVNTSAKIDDQFRIAEKAFYERGVRAPLMRTDSELAAQGYWRPAHAGTGADRVLQSELNQIFGTTFRKPIN